jgi:hypothetical protein
LFNKFKSTIEQKAEPEPEAPEESAGKGEKEKESKAARRERALKEREAQVRAVQNTVERDIGRSRGKLGREEAELEFGTVLTDAIRDPLVGPLVSDFLLLLTNFNFRTPGTLLCPLSKQTQGFNMPHRCYLWGPNVACSLPISTAYVRAT